MKDRVMNRIGELDSVNLQNFIQMISKEHRFLSSLFDSLQEAILVISPAHTILYHNAAAQEFLGLPENASALPVEKMLPASTSISCSPIPASAAGNPCGRNLS